MKEDERRNIQERHAKEMDEKIKQSAVELRDANKKLLLQKEELEAFAYIASHDLQEPLRKIQIFTDWILEKERQKLSVKGISYFNFIYNSAQQMQKMIEDLIIYSRLATDERKIMSTDLNIIVDKVKADLYDVLEKKGAIIETGMLCKVDIIASQFQQLLDNLVINALKFARPGVSPVIKINANSAVGSTLKAKGLNPNRKYCHITFSDNGIGFDNKYNGIVFGVFKRLHCSDEFPGTGIGLATVKKIVENHNGIITATSKVNKGTTFDIYIPAKKQ